MAAKANVLDGQSGLTAIERKFHSRQTLLSIFMLVLHEMHELPSDAGLASCYFAQSTCAICLGFVVFLKLPLLFFLYTFWRARLSTNGLWASSMGVESFEEAFLWVVEGSTPCWQYREKRKRYQNTATV